MVVFEKMNQSAFNKEQRNLGIEKFCSMIKVARNKTVKSQWENETTQTRPSESEEIAENF